MSMTQTTEKLVRYSPRYVPGWSGTDGSEPVSPSVEMAESPDGLYVALHDHLQLRSDLQAKQQRIEAITGANDEVGRLLVQMKGALHVVCYECLSKEGSLAALAAYEKWEGKR